MPDPTTLYRELIGIPIDMPMPHIDEIIEYVDATKGQPKESRPDFRQWKERR